MQSTYSIIFSCPFFKVANWVEKIAISIHKPEWRICILESDMSWRVSRHQNKIMMQTESLDWYWTTLKNWSKLPMHGTKKLQTCGRGVSKIWENSLFMDGNRIQKELNILKRIWIGFFWPLKQKVIKNISTKSGVIFNEKSNGIFGIQ